MYTRQSTKAIEFAGSNTAHSCNFLSFKLAPSGRKTSRIGREQHFSPITVVIARVRLVWPWNLNDFNCILIRPSRLDVISREPTKTSDDLTCQLTNLTQFCFVIATLIGWPKIARRVNVLKFEENLGRLLSQTNNFDLAMSFYSGVKLHYPRFNLRSI